MSEIDIDTYQRLTTPRPRLSIINTMNNPVGPMGLDPSSLNPPSSSLSSRPSSDGFGPDDDDDDDQAFISKDDKLYTDEDDEAPTKAQEGMSLIDRGPGLREGCCHEGVWRKMLAM